MTRRPRLTAWRVVFAALIAAACRRSGAPAPDAGTDGAAASFDELALARAEDTRRAKDVPPEVRTSHDVAARRRSARALSRIADAESAEALASHLADEDPQTVAWAAYGLGQTCKGREDAHVRMLAARAASLSSKPAGGAAIGPKAGARGVAELDPRVAVARAIGRCAGALSEPVLLALLGRAAADRGPWTDPALLGLGDLATRRRRLGADAMTTLLDAAGARSAPLDLAFYALSRAEHGEAFARRAAEVARVALGRPGEARMLAVRTLGHAGRQSPKETAPELGRVVADSRGFDAGERAEAARALGGLGAPGQAAIAGAIAALTPDAKDPVAIANLAGPDFHVLHTLLRQLDEAPPKKAEAALSVLASLTPPAEPKPGFARRLAELRCSAALARARGAYDADDLRRCDDPSSEISERARLASLLRRSLTGARLAAFRALAKSEHLRVREAAVDAIASHPELGEVAAQLLADALSSKHAGLVATAAEAIHAHPERAMVLAASERRAALDPRAPPPTAKPAQEVAPAVAKALSAALAAGWPADRFETRIALVEAAASLQLDGAKEAAKTACSDANPVLRERGDKALRSLGAPVTECADAGHAAPAAEIGHALDRPAKIVLTTDAGELSLVLEPELSPVTATRLASLARSGFYEGIVVHRVVPGFVVQLGDPDGDGYGGSGTSLRCETSPVRFHRLDVGMALAGRDTGSSQFFVTLSGTPHLDGQYTRVGRAEGDWASVAEGDVVLEARVVE